MPYLVDIPGRLVPHFLKGNRGSMDLGKRGGLGRDRGQWNRKNRSLDIVYYRRLKRKKFMMFLYLG